MMYSRPCSDSTRASPDPPFWSHPVCVCTTRQAESIEVEAEALTALGEVGAKGSLRYAVQMLTPARILAETYGREKVRG